MTYAAIERREEWKGEESPDVEMSSAVFSTREYDEQGGTLEKREEDGRESVSSFVHWRRMAVRLTVHQLLTHDDRPRFFPLFLFSRITASAGGYSPARRRPHATAGGDSRSYSHGTLYFLLLRRIARFVCWRERAECRNGKEMRVRTRR